MSPRTPMGQLSPRQVALLAALAVGAVAAGTLVLCSWWSPGFPIWHLAFSILIIFFAAFGAFSFGIDRFINSRIKVLYRTVHDLKRTRKDPERLDPKGDVIGQVSAEVSAWSTERMTEIKELREREKFRREFIGNLAHELKTPIFNIQGYILTLLEGGLEDDNVNRDFLNRASNGVDRLMKLVEDLDLITKLESGVMDLRIARMDLSELVTETIENLEIPSKEKNVKLVNGLGPALPVLADRNRLTQVFTNLFNNAINYGSDGGTCTVRSYPLDDQVLVEVSDDGIGISKEHLPRLFERFYRVGKSRARNEGGSGLGLAIVKHIVEAHGGTITVKSTEGEGTTFSFTLRRAV
ncbi:MAG: sensor histidine kinase [Flavobacteriales bacterium]|nr:sensor histidine kinase [Flavobacteriales bacterium]